MTVASITFAAVGGNIPAIRIDDAVTEVVTPSGSNQVTTAATTADRVIIRIAADVALYVSVGTAPNATSDPGRFLLPAGAVEYVAAGSEKKAAVILA